MTKTQVVLISVIVGLAILFLFSIETNQTSPQVKVRFVGFTNDPYGKPEIRFSFTNYSQRMAWDVAEMSKGTTNGWEAVKLPSKFITYATNPLPSSFEVGIPISETNLTWRLIFRFNEKTTGLEGIIDSCEEFFGKIKTGVPEERYMGRLYYVTNETRNVGEK